MRERIDLTGPWRFQIDPYTDGHRSGYSDPEHDASRWREVELPVVFDRCGPGMRSYEGAGWFRRSVGVPEEWRGRRAWLRFEGVNYHAAVWVNGEPAGAHEDGFLRFDLPVHHLLRFGEENLIAVRADNVRRPGEVPGLERGWRPFGGVLREVELMATDLLHVDSIRTDAVPDAAAGKLPGGRFTLRASVVNERAGDVEVELRVGIAEGAGEARARFSSGPVPVPASGETELSVEGGVPGVRPWSPDTPVLYTALVELRTGGEVVDSRQIRVGFRRIETEGDSLLLNGERIFLAGFNRHEDSPRTDMSPDVDLVRRDLLDMKDAGANFVRLCHYPHHPRELDLCDEIGLLVMAEIPLYWWNGLEEGEESCARKLAAARRQLAGMIRRDADHPSIVFWSVSNETREDRPEVAAGNSELVRLAKSLDPTRLAVHVSDHWTSASPVEPREHPQFEPDDVACVNAYPSWSGRARDPGYQLASSGRFWRENLARLHSKYPGKPILVTEFGYPSLEGVSEGALSEDMQARAIEAEFGGFSAGYVTGATIWCWADHPWPEEDFISFLTTSPFGVVTRERKKLAAAGVVKRLFTERRPLT